MIQDCDFPACWQTREAVVVVAAAVAVVCAVGAAVDAAAFDACRHWYCD